jgi:CheY-like chemotaxis protein
MTKILICDDDLSLVMIVRFLMKKEGIEVVGISDPREALAATRQHAPNLILLDLMMEGTDGFTVLGQLRADPETAAIPVIVLSALEQREYIDHAYSMGANGYLVKPFEPVSLRAEIFRVLEAAGGKPA